MSHDRKELLQSLAEKMLSVMRRVRAGQGFRFSGFMLRPSQVRILFFIARKGEELTVKDLAEMLGVTSGAATQFVNRLVDMDLVVFMFHFLLIAFLSVGEVTVELAVLVAVVVQQVQEHRAVPLL